MLDFAALTIQRVCIHTIYRKEKNQPHATVEFGNTLVELGDRVADTILQRLTKYCGDRSKAFELTIKTVGESSFFTPASGLRGLTDDDFIQVSKRLAQLLAEKQRSSSPRTANLFLIDAVDEQGRPVVICIKAESTDAIAQELQKDEPMRLKQVENLFMGQTERFFKVGAIHQLPPTADNIDKPPHEQWGAVLYDHLFRTNTKPASYFYEDFMGLDASQNQPLQSKEVYSKLLEFLDKHYADDLHIKSDLRDQIEAHLCNPNLTTIDLDEIKRDLIPPDQRDVFNEEVVNFYPNPIIKDLALIQRKLSEGKLRFSSGVALQGPSKEFRTLVDVVENETDLQSLQLGQGYTIIKVKGNPERYLRYVDAEH